MNDNPTLRKGAQAFLAWLNSVWDIPIPVNTIIQMVKAGFPVVMIGLLAFFIFAVIVMLIDWLARLRTLTLWYRANGYPWLHALRLAQADIEHERAAEQRKTNPYYEGEPSGFAATSAEREAWTQSLASTPARNDDPSVASPEGELSWWVVAILIVGAMAVVTLLLPLLS
jgi:hypothetical protein